MRRSAWLAAVALALAACGGSGGAAAPAAPPATTAPAVTEVPAATGTPAPPSSEATGEAASMATGSIAYRVVNLTGAPVDVYLRTQGVVHAFPAATAVAPGSVTGDLYPPELGEVVVLPSGASGPTDPACVIDCAFLGESSTSFGEGDRRLLVVRDDGATEYWEHADTASVGATANALPPADPAQALLIAEAQGVTDATFGLRVAYAGAPGCQADATASSFLLGGTVVMTYPMDPAGTDVTLHGNDDQDCSGTAVGGPFPVTGAVGSRTFLLLWGTMGAMQGLPVPLP